MKIAAFGWYGHNNAGDERIKYCLSSFIKSLGGIDSINFYDLHEEAIKGPTSRFDEYNLVIIGGGGLILSQHNYHEFILGINTKMATLGISVETDLKGNPKKFAEALLEKSDTLLVRDKGSYEKLQVLDGAHKAKITSDLTFLLPFTAMSGIERKHIGINLLPKPKSFKYSTLSNKFLSILLGHLERVGLGNLLKTVSFEHLMTILNTRFKCLPIPMYCDPQQGTIPTYRKNDVNFLKEYFDDVPESFEDNMIDRCLAFLSMRLHGAIFAVQKGIPIIGLEYLPKNKNFMKEVGLERFVINSGNPKDFLLLLDYLQKNDLIIREKMASYTEKASATVRRDVTKTLNSLIR